MRTPALVLAGILTVVAASGGGAARAADAADPAQVLRAEQAMAPEGGIDGYLVRYEDPTLVQRLLDVVTTGAVRSGSERAELAIAEAGGTTERSVRETGPGGLLLADLTDAEAQALLGAPGISAVVPNLPVELYGRRVALVQDVTPNATIDFWNLDRADREDGPLDDEYHYTTTGSGVDVYVLDTGIRLDHLDFLRTDGSAAILPSSTFTGGYFTFGTDTTFPGEDCDGHGTHVAGTVAGRLSGVAKRASVVPVRIFPFCSSGGSVADIISGLDWVVQNRREGVPAVVNMSLGSRLGPSPSAATIAAYEVYDDELEAVIADGVVVVVAAGNSDEDACWHWPARVPAAITVGAVDAADVRSDYPDLPDGTALGSNFGSCVDVFAPGSDIWSACGIAQTTAPYDYVCGTTSYLTLGGTSMAAPFVAGLAARHLEAEPADVQADVAAAIVGGAWPGLLSEFRPATSWDDLGSPNLLANSVFLEPEPTALGVPVVLPCGAGDGSSGLTQLATGGVAPLTWSVISGTLPGSLALSSVGRLTGTADLTSVTGAVTVQVEDAFGRTASTVLQRALLPPGCTG